MCQSLMHRGPDANGEEIYQLKKCQVGFGHRRLSIIDLSIAASQPMHYKGYSIIFNGEIYNYDELRNELIKEGHQFKTNSDTEVILHAFEAWGIKAINRFVGMFVFALYDNNNEKVYCVRDRVGVKPFYYYWKDDLFLFGSELKALMTHTNFKRVINYSSLASFLQYAYVPAPHSIFENTYKLKPGHYLEFDINNKSLSCCQYWNVYDAYNRPKLSLSFADAVEETTNILTKAFEYRMVADVPVGVFLSGGYDSACVSALLQKGRTDKLKTFTIGMPLERLNEAPFAKTIAEYLGTDHTEYYCTEKEALDIIPLLPYYYDEPFADSSAIPTVLVSRVARQSVTVALSADGGDETFAGYTRYRQMQQYFRSLQYIPKVVRYPIASIMDFMDPMSVPVLRRKYSFVNRYTKLRRLFKDPALKEVLQSSSSQYYGQNINEVIKAPVRYQLSAFDSAELKPDYFDELTYFMAIDYQTFLADDILHKVDGATMSVSLEGREPFLDHHIIEWAAQLPTSFKYNNGNTKYILKEIVHKQIPRKLMERPKMGFSIPIADWLEGQLSPLLDYYLSENFLNKQNIFHTNAVLKIRNSFLHGRTERVEKLWCLLMFQMWYEKWMK